MGERARPSDLPLIYAHLVGGQDEVMFDGASFAVNADGSAGARRPSRGPVLRRRNPSGRLPAVRPDGADLGDEEELWHALVLGVRDYIGKNGFPRRAAGPVRRHRLGAGAGDRRRRAGRRQGARGDDAFAHTADISWIDAREMSQRLGVRYDEISIKPSSRPSRPRWPRSSPGCPRTRPRRTSRRASAACC